MRLKCELQTVHREEAAGRQPAARRCRALLVLSGRPSQLRLSVYTASSARARNYQLSALRRVFARHLHQGKLSLSFATPAHDLLLSGDPLLVAAFRAQLAEAARAAGDPSAPTAASVTVAAAAPERVSAHQLSSSGSDRLVAHTSAEYVRAFPAALRQLVARGVRLRRVEERLLRLQQLRALDLSDNRLRQLPAIDARLPQLCELRVANNQLAQLQPLSAAPCGSQLAYLDVSGNQLTALPATLAFLSRLHYLNAADNQLTTLPDALWHLRQLRVLNVSKNRLGWLPSYLERLPLHELDASWNAPVAEEPSGPQRSDVGAVASLVQLAAVSVASRLAGRLPSPELVPVCVLELLQRAVPCWRCCRACYADAAGTEVRLDAGPLRHRTAALALSVSQGASLPVRRCVCRACRDRGRRRR